MLEPAARAPDADATVRQNLALAYALAGDWTEARDDRRAGRSRRPARCPHSSVDAARHAANQPADQVAALVGVTPAAVDPGQPVAAWRSTRRTRRWLRLRLCRFKLRRPCRSSRSPRRLSPPAPVAVAPAPPPVELCGSRSGCGSRCPSSTLPARQSAKTAAVRREEAERCSGRSRAEMRNASAGSQGAFAVRTAAIDAARSTAVVQLGAYSSPKRVLAAWNGEARKYRCAKALPADERPLREPEGHLLPPVGPGLRQRR